jgi:hypothetical protein
MAPAIAGARNSVETIVRASEKHKAVAATRREAGDLGLQAADRHAALLVRSEGGKMRSVEAKTFDPDERTDVGAQWDGVLPHLRLLDGKDTRWKRRLHLIGT